MFKEHNLYIYFILFDIRIEYLYFYLFYINTFKFNNVSYVRASKYPSKYHFRNRENIKMHAF